MVFDDSCSLPPFTKWLATQYGIPSDKFKTKMFHVCFPHSLILAWGNLPVGGLIRCLLNWFMLMSLNLFFLFFWRECFTTVVLSILWLFIHYLFHHGTRQSNQKVSFETQMTCLSSFSLISRKFVMCQEDILSYNKRFSGSVLNASLLKETCFYDVNQWKKSLA